MALVFPIFKSLKFGNWALIAKIKMNKILNF